MTKIEVQKVKIIGKEILDDIIRKIEGIPFNREINSYEKEVDIAIELGESDLIVEGHITQSYKTRQIILGDRIAYEDEPFEARFTEFHAYLLYEGQECEFFLSTRQGEFEDYELESEIEKAL